ncbi:MAG: hypothetical protein Q8O35_11540 [Humidesulfovibrio sp.]|uniref:hypothetical protein n=1 Tax=Humidesulfovibrio sp. TaxID=2910988 RepID=UPI00273656A3|nr:hypothetical protein [Humidesulfovibrio sp.]MDP2848806.1 hypothetical protein [Humidesulfovibrio sp.]
MNQPCAFHDQSMVQLRTAVLDLKDQMREAIEGVAAQSRANGDTLVRIADSQVARRELCARQEERLSTMERGVEQHRESHMAEREEHLAERAELWNAVNKLRFHVYVGLGAGLVLQLLAPLALRLAMK